MEKKEITINALIEENELANYKIKKAIEYIENLKYEEYNNILLT